MSYTSLAYYQPISFCIRMSCRLDYQLSIISTFQSHKNSQMRCILRLGSSVKMRLKCRMDLDTLKSEEMELLRFRRQLLSRSLFGWYKERKKRPLVHELTQNSIPSPNIATPIYFFRSDLIASTNRTTPLGLLKKYHLEVRRLFKKEHLCMPW